MIGTVLVVAAVVGAVWVVGAVSAGVVFGRWVIADPNAHPDDAGTVILLAVLWPFVALAAVLGYLAHVVRR